MYLAEFSRSRASLAYSPLSLDRENASPNAALSVAFSSPWGSTTSGAAFQSWPASSSKNRRKPASAVDGGARGASSENRLATRSSTTSTLEGQLAVTANPEPEAVAGGDDVDETPPHDAPQLVLTNQDMAMRTWK